MKSAVKFLLSLAVILTPLKTIAWEKVAIIDTGLNPSDRRFSSLTCKDHTPWDFVTNKALKQDVHGHGTHVAGLIKRYAENAKFCMLVYRYYDESNTGAQNLLNEIRAIRRALEEGATIINISGGGPEWSDSEYFLIKQHPNVKFVVAAGNEKNNIDILGNEYYPASYKLPNIISVGAMQTGCTTRLDASNYGKTVKFWELGENVRSDLPAEHCRSFPPGDARCDRQGYMSGTSQATAIHTGKILAGKAHEGCTKQAF